METTKKEVGQTLMPVRPDFFERLWEESWAYIKTVVDVVREPVLILNKNLHVMAANESFYRTFQVNSKDTEQRIVYELGNGQWNIPALRKLLEDILPASTSFKGFEVTHEFPVIGRKVMILSARQVHFKEGTTSELFMPIILLAMKDVTEMMVIAEAPASHANDFEARMVAQTRQMEAHISSLEMEIDELQKRP